MIVLRKPPEEQRFVLYDVSWEQYCQLLEIFDGRRLRITYDQGALEIMTLSHRHESNCYLLSRLVDALTEELRLPVAGGGSSTFRRELHKRGLEPDSGWWIKNEAKVRGLEQLDLDRDPPPDLGLEVDITSSSLDRMSIYASLRVPELWRYDGEKLNFYRLDRKKLKYVKIKKSKSFPELSAADLLSFLKLRGELDENAIVRRFRKWVRDNLVK